VKIFSQYPEIEYSKAATLNWSQLVPTARPLHDIKRILPPSYWLVVLCSLASVVFVLTISPKVIDWTLVLPPLPAYRITVCRQLVTGR